jgi:hypothetical protein
MRRNIKIKPSKQASIPGFIGGIVFVLIGIFIAIPNFGLFGVFWTIMAIIITATNGINAFSDKGIPTEEIYIESDEYENKNIKEEKELDFEEKLRKLKSLKDDGIISEIEYETKRVEILNQLK